MTYTSEKITFGLANMAAGAVSTIGAIITEGEARWLYVTITASIIASTSLALMFRRAEETIRVVIGRSLFALLVGVLGSRFAVHKWGITFVDGDVVLLAFVAAAAAVVGFILGYPALALVNAKSGPIVKKLLGKWLE